MIEAKRILDSTIQDLGFGNTIIAPKIIFDRFMILFLVPENEVCQTRHHLKDQ